MKGIHGFRCSPHIARMVKPKRVGWTGHVARTHGTEEIYLQVRKI